MKTKNKNRFGKFALVFLSFAFLLVHFQDALAANNALNSGSNNLSLNNVAPANGNLAPANNLSTNGTGNLTRPNNMATNNLGNSSLNGAKSNIPPTNPFNNLNKPANAAPTNLGAPMANPALNTPPAALNAVPPPPTNAAPINAIQPPPTNAFSNVTGGEAPAAPSNTASAPKTAPIVASEKNFEEATHDPEKTGVEEKISDDMRRHLLNDLNRYCLEYCNVLSVDVFSQEIFDTGSADLGFETVSSKTGGSRKFKVKSVKATILVDARFGSTNIEKIQKLFAQLDERYPYKVEYKWSKVGFPDTGNTAKSEAEVRNDFANQVRNQLERIVTEFCPDECKVHSVDVAVSRASVDEVQSGAATRYLFARDGRGALYVRGVSGRVSINSNMEAARKQRIQGLMREHLLPFGTVAIDFREMPFPKSAKELEKDLAEERKDPFGLAKLDAMLKMIKEHGNTKEIYKERDTTSNTSENSLSRSESEKNSENSSLSKELTEQEKNNITNSSSNSSQNSENNKENGETFWTQRNMMIVGGILLALLIVGAMGLRHVVTGKRMQAVLHEGNQGATMSNGQPGVLVAGNGMGYGNGMGGVAIGGGTMNAHSREEFTRNLDIQNLRDELIQTFVTRPKVAQDVFGRMLRDDGIENSSKYVTIFGEMIVFELLGDADLKKEIATLAEYIHVNLPVVGEEEQLALLKQLKLRMTAGKMRLMSTRTLDVFDFLKSKSSRQIYELISDESTKCQGIVLTQLSTEKRRDIFELFDGNAKVDLLRELSGGDLVARDYLINVAEALRRKALSRPNFDGENVRGTDVLLDLLERADLQEQRDLMADLDQTNAEASRLLRSRLVTVETLPFLRDGLLIEIFLNMEPQAMACFLAGTREHIRRLIFSKAPSDLSAGWSEALDAMRSIDGDAYRLAEMQVISKIRGLASSGMINLLDVNSSLYPKYDSDSLGGENPQTKRAFKINKPIVA